MGELRDHARRKSDLIAAVLDRGSTEPGLRLAAVKLGADGDASLAEPLATLCRHIGQASYRVTDAEVQHVREVLGSDKQAFEVILAACVGAGIARWDIAATALAEVNDAAE